MTKLKLMNKPGKAVSVDDYLSRLPADRRQALQSLRELLLSAIPGAEEVISYQAPVFKFFRHAGRENQKSGVGKGFERTGEVD